MTNKYWRMLVSAAITLSAIGLVTIGHRSNALARNNDNRWDEECWFEGCDNEEREEMYDNGDFLEEVGHEWWDLAGKSRFQAAFEAAELASPPSTGTVAWTYCSLMIDDFTNILGKSIDALGRIRNDCGAQQFIQGRPH